MGQRVKQTIEVDGFKVTVESVDNVPMMTLKRLPPSVGAALSLLRAHHRGMLDSLQMIFNPSAGDQSEAMLHGSMISLIDNALTDIANANANDVPHHPV